ncbi:MAG: V-type proton ATPase subunit E [Accumulibacter sp.]|uniref:ATPase n=1 Tax=Accumulibacter sp. TaxID=2053492 RepID=UPI001213644B|nr:ATPase [Accumulibacter sp.]QKS27691.1 MAG: ATPase [Candidatus Accumulibacter similis]TLD46659.1 MAG: V-type proton ATPase subunit E [Accumulibacter sp.]
MAIELQHLIDRINQEAVEKGEQEANRIVARAREQAAALVREGEAAARAHLEKAEKDSEVFVERSTRTLEQAARDLLISVGQAVENIIADIVSDATDEALDPDTLKRMMVKMAQAYAERNGTESRIEVLVGKEDQSELVRFFARQYRHRLVRGLNIRADAGVRRGFRVILDNDRVHHDFTRPAIAEALGNFLRPHLAEIVFRAARAASSSEPG